MAITGVNHVTLAVCDLDRAVAFYSDVLGGRLRARGPAFAYLSLGSLWLCLAEGPVEARRDYTHLPLSCAPGDFDAMRDRIEGAAPIWQDNASEGASVYFEDPDGHRLELHLGDLASRLDHYRAHPGRTVEIVT